MRIVGNIAKKFDLYLVRGVKAIGRAVSLIQCPESIGSYAMKIEVITTASRAGPGWTAAVTAAGTIVPVVFS